MNSRLIQVEMTLPYGREMKKGSAELLIASPEDLPRHGYEIGNLIEERTDGVLQFLASLCPTLHRLEIQNRISGAITRR